MNKYDTYEINPDDISGRILTGCPDASNGALMLNADNTEEMTANSERVAMNWPGQIL
jgi:hypothetical protein